MGTSRCRAGRSGSDRRGRPSGTRGSLGRRHLPAAGEASPVGGGHHCPFPHRYQNRVSTPRTLHLSISVLIRGVRHRLIPRRRWRPGVRRPLLSLCRIVQPAARLKPHIVVTRMRPVLSPCVVETLPDSVAMVDQTPAQARRARQIHHDDSPRPFTADGAAANWQVVLGTSRGPRPLQCCHEDDRAVPFIQQDMTPGPPRRPSCDPPACRRAHHESVLSPTVDSGSRHRQRCQQPHRKHVPLDEAVG